jgi:two-component system NtrC family sensor kinase
VKNLKKIITELIRDIFHPHDMFRILGKDRYKSLKIRIVLIDAFLSIVPLFIVITISYFWFQKILKDDFYKQLHWEIQNTKQTIEFFVDERLSALRFITSSYTYEQMSDKKLITEIFTKFKKEFGGLVDFGIINSSGIQESYTGPYSLEGKDYSNQEWFQEVIIRSYYVSDAFMGYRKIPHFAIAIKKELPEKGTFWILRATINIDTLQKYVDTINLRSDDDVFIINRAGTLQTPSRFHGDVLAKYKAHIIIPRQGVLLQEFQAEGDTCKICGFAVIKNSPWILVTVIRSTPYTKIPGIFRNELFFITMGSILLGIMFTIVMANTVVNRIKISDQERENAIAQSEHASKMASIGRLASGVAHEINNPLAIINEKAGLMKDILEVSGSLEQNKEKFLSLINGITESVNRCRTITHRLLGFSRRMEISQDAIDINDAVKEVIGFLEKEILYRNIRLELNLQNNLPKVTTDKGQVQQVFLNIINNAIDAVKEEGQIDVSSQVKNKRFVRVSIRDNGPGIPKENLKHIFEPFYTTKEKGKGTGLGLSISYGIMQKLRGTIYVESEVNRGTLFTVEIPINTAELEGEGM